MTRRPLVVSPEAPPEELSRLVQAARVRHLPLMDGDRLAGLWTATEDGPLVLLGPDSVHSAGPDDDAEEAVRALLSGREAAIVFEDGRPVGMLTRADVLAIVRTALARGIARPGERPLAVVLEGPAGAGKTTLLARTVPMLRECETGVVRADAEPGTPRVHGEMDGVPVVVDARAAWRAGLGDAIAALGDVQLVLVEDRDREPSARGGPGGDVQVLVVPATTLDDVDPAALREAQAIVLTRLDEAPGGLDVAAVRAGLRDRSPHVPVFAVAAGADDRGLEEWRDWLLGQVLPRGHRV
jgi:CBS domain-containing protein